MERGLLITLPNFDDATSYLAYYSKEIIIEAYNKGLIKIKEMTDKSELNLKSFSEILNNLDYNFVIFNGHGTEDSIYGYKDEVLVKVGNNEELLKERVIYARSCNAGLILANESMKNNKKGCFIGYKFPFVFFIDERWSSKPNNDNTAKLFLEPSNLLPISLIKGNSAMDSYKNSRRAMLKNMKKTLKNEKEPGAYIGALIGLFSFKKIRLNPLLKS